MENAEIDGALFSQGFPLCVLVCSGVDNRIGDSSSRASWSVRMALRYVEKAGG